MRKSAAVAALAAAFLSAPLLMAAPVQAAPAEATASVNVRSGPGTSYRVVDTLRPGQRVDVSECSSSGWCLVEKSGPDGWVSRNYLRAIGTAVPRPTPGRPDVGFSIDAPGFSFSFGNQRPPTYRPPVRPPQGGRDLVCLVTFERASQVAAGRDADVVRAQLMPRAQAERIDRPNDRNRIFTYGSERETRDTCRYLDRLN
jgi:uncharacterized protein YraI